MRLNHAETLANVDVLVKAMPDPVAILGLDFRYVTFNEAYRTAFNKVQGVALDVGDSILDALAHRPADRALASEYWARAFRGEVVTLTAHFGGVPNGQARYLEMAYAPIRGKDDTIVAAVNRCLDVTEKFEADIALRSATADLERRVAERTAALAESEERLRLAVESAKLGTWDYDLVSGRMQWSRQCKAIFGLSSDAKVTPESFLEMLHPDDRDAMRANFLRNRNPEIGTFRDEFRCVWPDGTVRWVVGIGTTHFDVSDGHPRPVRTMGTLLDITDAKQAERELQESEMRVRARVAELDSVLDAVPAAVFISHDAECKQMDANPVAREMLKLPEGRNASITAPPSERPTHFRLFKNGIELTPDALPVQIAAARGTPVENYEFDIAFDDGTVRNVIGNAEPLFNSRGDPEGAVGAFIDVTELRNAQAQLMEADRFSSIGVLAAGVAHEINNPLAYTISALEFLDTELRRVPAKALAPQVLEAVTEAREGVMRVKNVVRDLKTFCRADEGCPAAIDVRRVVESSISMALNELKHRARIVKEYGPVPQVVANESRLGQVFLNLLINAAQALPEGRVDENEVRITTGTDANGDAVVEVRDSGSGIPPDRLGRIFEPFFTTKPIGIGTGLGLYICQNIVTALGGKITVQSEVGRGTVFRVTVPPGAGRAEVTARAVASAPGRRARVLVVDDERAVGNAIRRLLEPEHDVTVLVSAREARDRLAGGERFDVIVCDLMMPDMTGMDLHAAIRDLAPELCDRMLFVTGGAFTQLATQFLQAIPNSWVEKPFDSAEFRLAVRRLAV